MLMVWKEVFGEVELVVYWIKSALNTVFGLSGDSEVACCTKLINLLNVYHVPDFWNS